MRHATLITSLALITSPVYGENIFKSLWNKVKNQPDLTKTHAGIDKLHLSDSFYMYRLSRDENKQTNKLELDADVVNHPDVVPVESKIDATPKSQEVAEQAVKNEKQVLYGDKSPLRDDAVAAAWDRAEQAQARLEKHREYMEQVRVSRKQIEQSKTVTSSINQTAE